jgi:hypothetical protein
VLNSGKNVPGGRTREFIDSRRSLRVTEYSGGEDCAEEGTERDKITEDSVKLCQEGIERVQRVHKKNSISSSEIREVSRRKTLTELLNTLQAQQGVLEWKLPRGHLHLFEGQKGQRPLRSSQLKLKETELLNTLEEDLCKECTRPTLRQSVEDNQLKASRAQGVCREENCFKFVSSRGIVPLHEVSHRAQVNQAQEEQTSTSNRSAARGNIWTIESTSR